MNRPASLYVAGIMAAATAVMAAALADWRCPNPTGYLIYLVLVVAASAFKVRIPGIRGTYSPGSIGGLFGIMVFSLPETLVAGCAAVLMQSVFRSRTTPKPVQVAFNLGNIILTIALSYSAWHLSAGAMVRAYPSVALAITACAYYVSSTLMLSLALALVDNKPLRSVWQEWYLWSFPYYLIGTVFVGLLPTAGHSFPPESLLILLPAIYLVHFYCGLAQSSSVAPAGVTEGKELERGARLFISAVVIAGVILLFADVQHMAALSFRFLAYLAVALIASTLKVKLPGMRGTISLNFVVVLVSIADLELGQAMLISALAGMAQSCWLPAKRPTAGQVAFNTCSLVISTAFAYTVGHFALGKDSGASVALPLAASTGAFFLVNTGLVSGVLSLINHESLSKTWHRCYFWCLPYYLIGSAAASIVVIAGRSNGWAPSLLVLPVLALVYVSFCLHVTRSSARGVTAVRGAAG